MELTNEFVIERPIDETWTILNDLEFIAPCMPGAQLTEIEGDEYRGLVKIKVGPITAQYKGKANFVEQNVADKVARLKAEGRDPRQGQANAMVTATMEEVTSDSTLVKIHTDLGLSGKIASFGRGAIEDVSKKILGQFTDNLRDKLAEGSGQAGGAATAEATVASEAATAAVSTATAAAASPSTTDTSTDTASANGAGTAGPSTVRKIDSPEAEPVDLMSVAGDSMAKRLAPVVGGAILLLLLRWFVRGGDSD